MPLKSTDIECNMEKEKYNKVGLHQNEKEQSNNKGFITLAQRFSTFVFSCIHENLRLKMYNEG